MTHYRHRETGTLASADGISRTLTGERTITLRCLDNPRRHYEEAFPFQVRREPMYFDGGSSPYLALLPGAYTTEPLTLPLAQFEAEWQPADEVPR